MSRLKATQSGKAGKHKGQDTFSTVFARSLRKARIATQTDRLLLEFLLSDSGEDQEGALAGKARRLKHRGYFKIISAVTGDKLPKTPMTASAG